MPSQSVLSRLPVNGAITATTNAAEHKYEGYVPLLGADNKLHPSVVGAASVASGDVTANLVTFVDPHPTSIDSHNVQAAIDEMMSGKVCLTANSLSDVGSSTVAFNNIKQPAYSRTNVDPAEISGVVCIATQAETEAGTYSSPTPIAPLALSPYTAKDTYLSKLSTTTQTIACKLATASGKVTEDTDSDSTYVTKAYMLSKIANSAVVGASNTLYVDPSGADNTGAKGNMVKPYLTIAAAVASASSGDLIVVNPGDYNENNLAKNGVNFYFNPGARIIYTGNSSTAIFNVLSSTTCNVYGYGKFYSQSTNNSKYVLYTHTNSKCIFEAEHVESYGSPIALDCGSTGWAKVNILGKLISDDGTGGGTSAAEFVTGVATLDVGISIYSGAAGGPGLRFGDGNYSTGNHTVRCPLIYGKYNAITFAGSLNSKVYTDKCYATDGSAIVVTHGDKNEVISASLIFTNAASSPAVLVSTGRLYLTNCMLWATTSQPIISLSGTAGLTTSPYLVLNNCEIWGRGFSDTAIYSSAVSPAYLYVRIIGAVQSDIVEPTTTIHRVGGMWEYALFSTVGVAPFIL